MTHYPRRAFLRSAAAVVALPMFISLTRGSARARGRPPLPLKFVAFYVPCGIHMPAWTPIQIGVDYRSPPILSPLANVKDNLLVLSGFANAPAKPDGPGDHASGTGSFLTCRHVFKTDGASIRNGVSVDQVMAAQLGRDTRIASLQLGIEGGSGVGGCDSGYSCAYARNISWASETQPLAKAVRPDLVFDRLFTGLEPGVSEQERLRRHAVQKSVLDYVQADAIALSKRLSRADRRKLGEYLDGVRELEKRTQLHYAAPLPKSTFARPASAPSFPEHVRLMLDLILIALESDSTRVATFMLGNAGSGRSYDFIGVSGGHHALSHHQGKEENFEKLIKIDTWEVEQLAYLLERMNVRREDGTRLLDESAVFFSSEIEDGNSHAHHNLPVLLAGQLGGFLPTGSHTRVPERTPLSRLFLTLQQGVGVAAKRFGEDGHEPLEPSSLGA